VPGAEVLDIFHNGPGTGTNSNVLTQLFLGGRTQTQAMTAAHPTFVTVWIGNNDVLGAALAQDTTLITRADSFQARYSVMLDSINAAGAKALLIGIGAGAGLPGRTAGLPYFSLGTTYFSLDSAGAFAPAPFTVLANCQHPRGDTVFVAFPVGAALIRTASGGTPTTLDCSNPAQVLLPPVVRALQRAIATFDTFIATQAATRGWAYIDFNAAFDSLAAAGKVAGFPLLGQPCSVSPFGAAFTCDGIHPSALSHHLIAQKIVQAINAKYASAIPAIP
jgi:phospholipase/lecithinase/hemolysin